MNRKSIKLAIKWVFTLAVVLVVFGFSGESRRHARCHKIDINVERISGMYFIDENTITEQLFSLGQLIIGAPLDSLQLQRMQASIMQLPSVKEAEVYATVDGVLKIAVTQRKPLFRVISRSGDSYYIDEAGLPMPLSKHYSAHVHVLTGEVKVSFAENPSAVADDPVIEDAYTLMQYIANDAFWSAQTEHLHVDSRGEFVLIPRVGIARIHLGNASQLDVKLTKLKVFYKEMALKNNLNKYKSINVKYRDQVVCERFF